MSKLLDLRKQLDNKEISSVELTKGYLKTISEKNDKLNAFITVTEELALKGAEEADRRIAEGETAPLLGIPLAVKDNICIKNERTTCASKILENYKPPYNATVIEKLNLGGAVYLGKTNMDEFAMGGSSQTTYFNKPVNPYGENCVPGGS